jgi:hypothetical protein
VSTETKHRQFASSAHPPPRQFRDEYGYNFYCECGYQTGWFRHSNRARGERQMRLHIAEKEANRWLLT